MTTVSTFTPVARAGPNQSNWIGGDMPAARLGLIISALVPGCILAWDAWHHQLGADPVNEAIHTTGLLALIFILLSLCVTPLRAITGFSWLTQFRRWLGLFGFFYACAHLSIFYYWDRGGSLRSTVHEITHRAYLIVGISALALMIPLAATSFNAAIRALGGKRWKALHRLVYLIAFLGCVHYGMEVKSDTRQPKWFFAALGLLLGYRVVAWLVHGRRGRAMAVAKMPAVTGGAAASMAKARFWKGPLRVVGIFDETASVRTFRLALPDGGEIPFAFAAGQFLNLTLDIAGKRVARSYTIASPPTRSNYIELTIKREPNGAASNYLHDMLMHDGLVQVSAPAGRFSFNDETPNLLLVAGGVGITPVMSILRDLTDRSWPGQIDLFFSVRSADEIIFASELQILQQRYPNVRVHFTITREASPDWAGLRGRISAEMIQGKVPDMRQRSIFICGPTAMADAVRADLLAAGVDIARIKLESFTPAAAVKSDMDTSPAEEMAVDQVPLASFARSNKTARLPQNLSVLEAAESVNVPIEFDCRSGICGTCRVRLLAGAVAMDVQDALTDADIKDGYILACQAHASGDVTVDA